jgi:hypothetical protein
MMHAPISHLSPFPITLLQRDRDPRFSFRYIFTPASIAVGAGLRHHQNLVFKYHVLIPGVQFSFFLFSYAIMLLAALHSCSWQKRVALKAQVTTTIQPDASAAPEDLL